MRVSTVAFLLGLLWPAAGYLYLRRWWRLMLAYGFLLLCGRALQLTDGMDKPQGIALIGLALGTVYIYSLLDAWQIGRRIDAQQLSAQMRK